jgi:hypothetical protein
MEGRRSGTDSSDERITVVAVDDDPEVLEFLCFPVGRRAGVDDGA